MVENKGEDFMIIKAYSEKIEIHSLSFGKVPVLYFHIVRPRNIDGEKSYPWVESWLPLPVSSPPYWRPWS